MPNCGTRVQKLIKKDTKYEKVKIHFTLVVISRPSDRAKEIEDDFCF